MVWRVFESCCHLRLEHLVSYFSTVLRQCSARTSSCRYGQNTHFSLLRPTQSHNSINFCKTLRKYLSRHVKGKNKISYTIAFLYSYLFFMHTNIFTGRKCVYCKVHIFWEGRKCLWNLHRRFDRYNIGQIYGGDFAKFCGLLRIYELYMTRHIVLKRKWMKKKWASSDSTSDTF